MFRRADHRVRLAADLARVVFDSQHLLTRVDQLPLGLAQSCRGDLRRYAPKVVLQNAGKLNVGEKQVHVAIA